MARYYNPRTERFISEDPIRDGLNWYTAFNNDPVNFIDPTGLAAVLGADYARGQGATVRETRDRSGNIIIHVTHNGKTGTFRTTNSSGITDFRGMDAAFGWSNPYIQSGQRESAFLGTHLVSESFNTAKHGSVIVFAGHDSALLNNHSHHFENNHWGMLYTTIGAARDRTATMYALVGSINRDYDVMLDIKRDMIKLPVSNVDSIN
jgi:hypothetical protein